jgi:hypothetical protein
MKLLVTIDDEFAETLVRALALSSSPIWKTARKRGSDDKKA